MILRAEGLRRLFGGVAAVDGVDLTVSVGERRAIIGPNGAGKTTLLNLLAGVQRPTSGRLYWRGRDITRRGPVARARAGIGRSFQTPTVFPTLSTLDNLRLCGGTGTSLEQLGLQAHAATPAGALAHGQRRLLDIAMAVARSPELLLLDEPAAGLHGDASLGRLLDLLAALPACTAIVLVEHHRDVVDAVATTVSEMRQGRICRAEG